MSGGTRDPGLIMLMLIRVTEERRCRQPDSTTRRRGAIILTAAFYSFTRRTQQPRSFIRSSAIPQSARSGFVRRTRSFLPFFSRARGHSRGFWCPSKTCFTSCGAWPARRICPDRSSPLRGVLFYERIQAKRDHGTMKCRTLAGPGRFIFPSAIIRRLTVARSASGFTRKSGRPRKHTANGERERVRERSVNNFFSGPVSLSFFPRARGSGDRSRRRTVPIVDRRPYK